MSVNNTISAREGSVFPPINQNGKNKTQIHPYDDSKDLQKKFDEVNNKKPMNASQLNKIDLPLNK